MDPNLFKLKVKLAALCLVPEVLNKKASFFSFLFLKIRKLRFGLFTAIY